LKILHSYHGPPRTITRTEPQQNCSKPPSLSLRGSTRGSKYGVSWSLGNCKSHAGRRRFPASWLRSPSSRRQQTRPVWATGRRGYVVCHRAPERWWDGVVFWLAQYEARYTCGRKICERGEDETRSYTLWMVEAWWSCASAIVLSQKTCLLCSTTVLSNLSQAPRCTCTGICIFSRHIRNACILETASETGLEVETVCEILMRGMKSISSGPFDVDSTNQRHCGLLLSYLRALRRYHWKPYLLSANNERTGPIYGIIETRTSKLKASNEAREYLYGRMLRLILGSQSDSTPWIFRVFVHSKVIILSTRPLYFRCVWMSSFFLYKFYGSVCTHYSESLRFICSIHANMNFWRGK